MNFPGQTPGKFLGIGLATNGRPDIGIKKIGQVDLRFLEQITELVKAVPLTASLKKTGQRLVLRAGAHGG